MYVICAFSGFGGLVVSMLSDFLGGKIHSMPSFGVDVKPPVSCSRFVTRKRTLRFTWKSESQANPTFT
jgi:hypothetical protein